MSAPEPAPRKTWTPADDQTLRFMLACGGERSVIATALGCTPKQVEKRMAALGLRSLAGRGGDMRNRPGVIQPGHRECPIGRIDLSRLVKCIPAARDRGATGDEVPMLAAMIAAGVVA